MICKGYKCNKELTDDNSEDGILCHDCAETSEAPYCGACGQPCELHTWTENMSESRMFPQYELFAESACCRNDDLYLDKGLTESWEADVLSMA